MSLLEEYRLFTGYYIYESEILSEDKLELIRFLKEASPDDIIDILSGEYAVEGLAEEDMEAVNTFLEGRYKSAVKYGKGVGEKVKGSKAVEYMGKGASKTGKKIKKVLGYEKLAAVKKAARGGNVEPHRYKKAVRGAIGRTALATGAVGGAGYGGYKGMKK